MALKGTLKDFGLADIFQLIGIQRKTGVLVLTNGGRSMSVSFLSGCVVSADSSERPLEDRLGTVLVKSGKITARQLEEGLRAQRQKPHRLGRILIDQKAITAEDLSEALRLQVTQIVHHLFRWRDGEYDFNQEETIDYDRDHFDPVPAENILMEGARMVDEWPIIERRIHSFQMILRRHSTDPSVGPDPVSVFDTDIDFGFGRGGDEPTGPEPAGLSGEETLVFGLVDGRSTVQDIIDRCHLGEFETCRILYELMSRDLIAESTGLVDRSDPPAAAPRMGLLLRAFLLLLPAMALVSLLYAARSPLAPLGGGLSDPFGVDRIRVHISQARVGRIDQAVRLRFLDRQEPPASLEDLIREGFLGSADLVDPWGRPYLYEMTPFGYAITGHGASGEPDESVSLRIEFQLAQRAALDRPAPDPARTR